MSHAMLYAVAPLFDLDELMQPYDEQDERNIVIEFTSNQDWLADDRAHTSFGLQNWQNSLKRAQKLVKTANTDTIPDYKYVMDEIHMAKRYIQKLQTAQKTPDDERIVQLRQEFIADNDGDDDYYLDANGKYEPNVPNAKFDYYLPSTEYTDGRWHDGLVTKAGKRVDFAKLKDIDLEQTTMPFAILSPDGEWHEGGRMGWFAMVDGDTSDWNDHGAYDLLVELQQEYPDMPIQTVDYHI